MAGRRKEREKFWKEFILNFINSNLPDLVKNLCELYKIDQTDLSIEKIENSSESINWAYWDLIDNHARPVINSISSSLEDIEEEDRVDLYKILSCIEYAFIKISPFYVAINQKQIDYSDSNFSKHKHLENLINGYLAFYGALEFLKRWTGKYSEIFSSESILQTLDSKENVEHRQNAMSLLSEHIYVVVYSAKSSVIPLFANACWWRLVCMFGVKNS